MSKKMDLVEKEIAEMVEKHEKSFASMVQGELYSVKHAQERVRKAQENLEEYKKAFAKLKYEPLDVASLRKELLSAEQTYGEEENKDAEAD